MSRVARQSLIPIAIVQGFVPTLPGFGIGQSIGARAVAGGVPPEWPLNVPVVIWPVIFAAYLTLAMLANVKPEHVEDRLAGPLALAGAGHAIWMFSAQMFGLVWLDFLILLPVLLCAWEAAHRLGRIGGFDGTTRRLVSCLSVGLMAGWLTFLVAISLPELGRWLLQRGPSDMVWQSLWLAILPMVTLAEVFYRRVSRSGWFVVALGSGMLGIAANTWYRTETHSLAFIVLIAVWIVIARRKGLAVSRPD